MKIERENERKTVPYKEIATGECFTIDDKEVYLKVYNNTDYSLCNVSFSTNELKRVLGERKVKRVNAKVTVER